MYIIALADENNLEEPWFTMYMLQDMYEMAMCGYISLNSFNKSFDDFILSKKLYSKTRADEYKPLKWWLKLFHKNRR